jgi:hypothetical protein
VCFDFLYDVCNLMFFSPCIILHNMDYRLHAIDYRLHAIDYRLHTIDYRLHTIDFFQLPT